MQGEVCIGFHHVHGISNEVAYTKSFDINSNFESIRISLFSH